MDILLAHGYFLYDDPHESKVMKPYPPLGILYISSYLKAGGFDVQIFDSTFRSFDDFKAMVETQRPSVVGLYTNLMTKPNILRMITLCKANGATVILGGPEPPYYAKDYLTHGADIIVKGEGEVTLEELLPHLAKHAASDMRNINGIAYLEDGQLVETAPRVQIRDLSATPW